MSCCGEKRKLLKTIKHSEQNNEINENEFPLNTDKSDRLFEYTGNASLKITGPTTGILYYFRFPGDRLEVDYYDSFGLMGERELKILYHN